MARGLSRTDIWASVAAAVGVVALAVGLVLTADRGVVPPDEHAAMEARLLDARAAAAAAEAAAATPPASIVLPADPRLLVFGDSYVEGNGADSSATTFARLAAGELGWPVETDGLGGTGFVNGGPEGDDTYLERVAELEPPVGPSVIVVQGGINDRGARGITAAATETLRAFQQRWPDAAVILLGPVNPNPPDPGVGQVTEQLRAAAAEAQVPFIDASGWITEDNMAQFGQPDQLHVNQAGHDYLGQRLAEAIRGLAAAP